MKIYNIFFLFLIAGQTAIYASELQKPDSNKPSAPELEKIEASAPPAYSVAVAKDCTEVTEDHKSVMDKIKYKQVHRDFLEAVQQNNRHKVIEFLENKVDVNYQEEESEYYQGTALMIAADKGEGHIVDYLLDVGADISKRKSDLNALDLASYRGHESIVSALIKKGAMNEESTSSLFCAINSVNTKMPVNTIVIVKKLIDAKANLSVKDKEDKTPLAKVISLMPREATDVRNVTLRSIAKLLIEAGSDINTVGDGNETLLTRVIIKDNWWNCKNGEIESVEEFVNWLIIKGIKVQVSHLENVIAAYKDKYWNLGFSNNNVYAFIRIIMQLLKAQADISKASINFLKEDDHIRYFRSHDSQFNQLFCNVLLPIALKKGYYIAVKDLISSGATKDTILDLPEYQQYQEFQKKQKSCIIS